MLYFALGFVLGLILGEVFSHAIRRYPPTDNSEIRERDFVGDIIAVEKEEGERYWKKNVPEDIQRTPKRVIFDR